MQRGGFVNRAKCPKCGGSVYLDNDYYGWFEECLMCGYTKNLQKVVKAPEGAKERYIEVIGEGPTPKK